jgi:hypothetical protein
VDAHRVEVLDRADDDAVAGGVAHHFELVLLPAVQRALDEDLANRAAAEPARNEALELGSVARDPAAGAAERERRTDDRRQRQVGRELGS